ncbi:N-acetyl-gamma-glutamyl-phosphate reductase [Dongshaea marina]|uniref:N-acetyl-gamma-glutamyl-phosphate reductase n=1 Tax=Dongshaea marina TaxID=2047966 RepID=UPI000D3E29A7|nr:N-acetyl-gamma-glutamyl-phosphate reductase [Dongshaea marina]
MLNTIIVGASGYTGAELTRLVMRHPHLKLTGLYVSEQSPNANQPISKLHGQLCGLCDQPLLPLHSVEEAARFADIVLLATDHPVSHALVPEFLRYCNLVVDLSGAYRVKSSSFYPKYYGFEHQHPQWLEHAVYGLGEWTGDSLKKARLIATPGCYPTAIQLALKPLIDSDCLDPTFLPVANATSGTSGAGRKASLTTHLNEVSLQPYQLFCHRHLPEMTSQLGRDLIFTPQLGNFPRGILATITCRLQAGVGQARVDQLFEHAYASPGAVRLLHQGIPRLQDVVNSPFCDIGWQLDGDYLIVISALDNLLKGAASQAVQCINMHMGHHPLTALN